MPFKSEKQRKWMHANDPEMAKKWEKEEELDECVTIAKMFSGDMVLAKNRDRNYRPRLKVVRDRTSYGVEVLYVVDVDTDWTEGMNEYGIGVVNAALFVKRDEKDYDKKKKTKAPSKDGVRVREALAKGGIDEAMKVSGLSQAQVYRYNKEVKQEDKKLNSKSVDRKVGKVSAQVKKHNREEGTKRVQHKKRNQGME